MCRRWDSNPHEVALPGRRLVSELVYDVSEIDGAPPHLLAMLEIPLKYHNREDDSQSLKEYIP